MTVMTAPRGLRRWLIAAAVLLSLLAAALLWHRLTTDGGAEVVDDPSAQPGWQTIQYQRVRVAIPEGWRRSRMGGCEFQYEHWAPPQSDPCASGVGISFYASATFDPAQGPGVRRTGSRGTETSPAWAGYVTVAEVSVYVSADDREVVAAALRSARRARPDEVT